MTPFVPIILVALLLGARASFAQDSVATQGPKGVVLSFTNFMQFESATFNTDPDTYKDHDFGATVLYIDRTVIEVVYSGKVPNSRRCRGFLKLIPS